MDQDNASHSDQPALSGINPAFGSPQSTVRRFRNQEVSRNEGHFVLNGNFTNISSNGNRSNRTPVTRTPQARLNANRNQGLSPLPELQLPMFAAYVHGESNSRSPIHGNDHQTANIFGQRSATTPLVVPIERNPNLVSHGFNQKFRMIGPIRNASKNLKMEDTIVAPSTERKYETVCYSLKKINLFKTKMPTEPVRREPIEHFEFPQTVVAPKSQKPKHKIKKGEKRNRKTRSRIVTAKLPKFFCYCKKSNCKKEYCNCYKNKQPCNSKCGCTECTNDIAYYESTRHNSGQIFPHGSRLVQTGHSYRTVQSEEGPMEVGGPELQTASRGCNCRKSFCQKKYCDCFSQGRKCTPSCHCDGCSNR